MPVPGQFSPLQPLFHLGCFSNYLYCDCLKGKEQKVWKEEIKTAATWLERLYRGESLCRAWGVRSVSTFGWNCHSPYFVVKPSVFVVVFITAPLVLILFLLLHIAETSPVPRPAICGQPLLTHGIQFLIHLEWDQCFIGGFPFSCSGKSRTPYSEQAPFSRVGVIISLTFLMNVCRTKITFDGVY